MPSKSDFKSPAENDNKIQSLDLSITEFLFLLWVFFVSLKPLFCYLPVCIVSDKKVSTNSCLPLWVVAFSIRKKDFLFSQVFSNQIMMGLGVVLYFYFTFISVNFLDLPMYNFHRIWKISDPHKFFWSRVPHELSSLSRRASNTRIWDILALLC